MLVVALLASIVMSGCPSGLGGRPEAFPDTIAGFGFGMSEEQAQDLCARNGFQAIPYDRKTGSGETARTLVCVGPPKPAPVGEFAQLEATFCGSELCLVKLVNYDGKAYETLKKKLTATFGAPRLDETSTVSNSQGQGADGATQRVTAWSWYRWMVRLSYVTMTDGREYVFLFYANPSGFGLF